MGDGIKGLLLGLLVIATDPTALLYRRLSRWLLLGIQLPLYSAEFLLGVACHPLILASTFAVGKGSGLLINGRSVQGQIDDNRSAINSNRNNINSLGEGVAASTALNSAMTALPTVSADSQLTCGVGTGAYSGATAVALGCATRINDRFSMTIAGSKVLQGSSSYEYGSGSLDSFAARAGLVMRLGKLHKPTATDEELQARLQQVEAENQEIQQQNKRLMARLERLEAIALGIQPKADELAVVPGALAK